MIQAAAPAVTVASLEVDGFRNIAHLAARFCAATNVFYGDNAAGKTNLLESLHVVLLGRSQRGAADAAMVGRRHDVYRLTGTVGWGDESHDLAVACERGGRKRVTIDGVNSRTSELYGLVRAVSVGPEDSAIVAGPPSRRRSFVDMYLAQLSRRYLNTLTDYTRVVAQRNAALREGQDSSGFDPLLIEYGAEIIVARRDFLVHLASLGAGHYGAIAEGACLEVRYRPSVNGLRDDADRGEIQERFADHLISMSDRERLLGATVVGPHRDEIEIDIDGVRAREFGSQGEWRSAAIALKLAVYDLLRQREERCPVLLLDEIFAELDQKRSAALIDAFGDMGQVFLSTASRPPERLLAAGGARSFRMAAGELQESD